MSMCHSTAVDAILYAHVIWDVCCTSTSMHVTLVVTDHWQPITHVQGKACMKMVKLHNKRFASSQPLLAWIFWADSTFWPPWTKIAHGPKGKFGHFESKGKRGKISTTREATVTKIGLHAFQINLYLHEFLRRFYFLTPMDYSPWFEGKFWPFLKAIKKDP